MPVCICPLAKPVPVCIYRDPNTKTICQVSIEFCAIHTADNIITDGKVRMVRPIEFQIYRQTDRQTEPTTEISGIIVRCNCYA